MVLDRLREFLDEELGPVGIAASFCASLLVFLAAFLYCNNEHQPLMPAPLKSKHPTRAKRSKPTRTHASSA